MASSPFFPVTLESREQMEDEAAFGRHTPSMFGICAPDQRGPLAHRLDPSLGALVLLLAEAQISWWTWGQREAGVEAPD